MALELNNSGSLPLNKETNQISLSISLFFKVHTHTHTHIYIYIYIYIYMCVCVCERERERECVRSELNPTEYMLKKVKIKERYMWRKFRIHTQRSHSHFLS